MRAAWAVLATAVVALFAGIWIGGHPENLPDGLREVFVDSSITSAGSASDNALEVISDNYFRETDSERLQDASIRGMVERLRRQYKDRFSHYFDAEQLADFNRVDQRHLQRRRHDGRARTPPATPPAPCSRSVVVAEPPPAPTTEAPAESHGRAKGPPLAWITRFAPLIAKGGRILDLAAGGGRHTRFFVTLGHPVTAVDIDVSGLADLDRQPAVEIIQADLEDGSPWPLGERRFAAVVVTNYLWRPLFPHVLKAVDTGGLLLYETFARGNEAFGRPDNPDFLLQPGELLDLVRGQLQVVAYEHGRHDQPRPMIKQRICAIRATPPVVV